MLDEQRNSETIEKTGNREEEEYEEKFEIEVTLHKGSSIKIESSSYNELDELLEKALIHIDDWQKKNLVKPRKNYNINNYTFFHSIFFIN